MLKTHIRTYYHAAVNARIKKNSNEVKKEFKILGYWLWVLDLFCDKINNARRLCGE